MGTLDPLGLVWNQHKENLGSTFQELRRERDFLDVTLACDDQDIVGHKLVLAASSPFLRGVFQRHPGSHHPLVFLKGFQARLVSLLVDFMYIGEVEVEKTDLPNFLALAKDLQVRGLCGESRENMREDKGSLGCKRMEKEENISARVSDGVNPLENRFEESEIAIQEKIEAMEGDQDIGGREADGEVDKEEEGDVLEKVKGNEKVKDNDEVKDNDNVKDNDKVKKVEAALMLKEQPSGEREDEVLEEDLETRRWSKDKQLNDWIASNAVNNHDVKETGDVEKEGEIEDTNSNAPQSREDANDSAKSDEKAKDERWEDLPPGWRRRVHKREGGKTGAKRV